MKKQKPLKEKDVGCVSFDWKETPDVVVKDVIEQINKLLDEKKKGFQIDFIEDPITEGSDAHGYFFAFRPFQDADAERIAREIYGDELFDTGKD